MNSLPVILVILVVLAVVSVIVWAAIAAEKRRQQRIADLWALANELGLRFNPGRDTTHDDEYAHFELFRRGFDRAAYNTISGPMKLDDLSVTLNAGDFTYKTRETYATTVNGRTQTRTRVVKHHFSYLIVDLPFGTVPDLLIRREGLFDKIASAFGKNDIDYESAEFSRKYFVQCDDRKFAYDIIHPRMMEFLLESKPGLIDIENARLRLSDGYEVWEPPRFSGALRWTRRFLDHWPDFVVNDLTATGRDS